MINRGLAIFDDYSNLPIVSIIATGDVPPHFYLNPEKILDYHYGMHLLAASLVCIGGFFPWSALDLIKSFSIALAVLLTLLWYRRYISKKVAWLWGGLFTLFGAGSRWLLLLVPSSVLLRMSDGVQMIGSGLQTGPNLYTALTSPWKIEGGGPIPFPFAFVNGISNPLSLDIGGNGAFPLATLALLLLLSRRRWRPWPGLMFGLMMVSLALTSEHLFIIIWVGTVIAALVRWFHDRSLSNLVQWGWPLLPGIILTPIMGGVLSATALRWWTQAISRSSSSGVGLPGVSTYWPPAFFSAHLGALKLTDISQLTIALAEMGPVLFLAPCVTLAIKDLIKSNKIFIAGLGIMSLISFLMPLFIRFTERARDITRLTGTALTIWMVLGLPYMWQIFKRGSKLTKSIIITGYGIAILGGIALLPEQLISITRIQPSYFIQEPDVVMCRRYWDGLEKDAWMLDPAYPYRPPTLFARTTGPAYQDAYIRLPKFRELVARFDPVEIALSGYSYIYIDRETWQSITPEQRQAFQQRCIKMVYEQKTDMGDFRRLFDIRKCRLTSNVGTP
jgi:hypothetical protein